MRVPAPASVAVLAAQLEEVAPLLARLGARRDGADRAAAFWRGAHRGLEVTVAVSGIGRRRARAATLALLGRAPASQLLVVGVAGALAPELEVGAAVLAAAIATESGDLLRADPEDLRAAVALGARPAAVMTVDRMIATAADRRALHAALAATLASGVRPDAAAAGSSGATAAAAASAVAAGAIDAAAADRALLAAAVVDMESYDAVEAAFSRSVPALVLRVVSDAAGDELPGFLERCRRGDGDLDRRRVIVHALTRPAAIPGLLELRRRVRAGAETLADLVARLLPSLAG